MENFAIPYSAIYIPLHGSGLCYRGARDFREDLGSTDRERFQVASPRFFTHLAQLNAPKPMASLCAVGVAETAIVTGSVLTRLQKFREVREHQLLAPGYEVLVALGVLSSPAIRINPVPELEVLARLVNNLVCLGLANSEALFDKSVPPHHHMDWATKETDEVDNALERRPSCPGHIQGPEHLAALVEGLDAQVGRHIGEGAVCLSLGPVLEEGHGVVECVPSLSQDFELFVREPDMVEIVACQCSGNSESGKSIGVAHPKPMAR